jgi:hypothetical protein
MKETQITYLGARPMPPRAGEHGGRSQGPGQVNGVVIGEGMDGVGESNPREAKKG